MTQLYPFVNGGWIKYPDRVTTKTFFRATDRYTKNVTVKAGQVLKAHSFLESIQGTADAGKVIAHKGISEAAEVTFKALTSGQTLILAGLTFTAGSAGATAAQLAIAWAGIADGVGYAAATTAAAANGIDSTIGTFTAGSLTGWNTYDYNTVDATAVDFRATSYLTNVTDLAATGTGSAPTINKVDGNTSFNKIAGVTLYDVDASSADQVIPVYVEASFWAEALVWAVNPAIDTITDAFGNTVACTAYNTGVYGPDAAVTKRLQQQFVEQSEFEPIGFLPVGDVLGGTDYNV